MSADIFQGIPTEELTVAQMATATKEELVMHTLRKAVPYAVTVGKGQINAAEALSLAYEALTLSSRTYDPKGIPFFNYSKPFIRSSVFKHREGCEVVRHAWKHRTVEEVKTIKIDTASPEVNQDWEANIPITKTASVFNMPVEPEFELIDLHEKWKLVEPHFKSLTERERTIIRLIHESGFTHEKIGILLVPRISKEAVHIAYDRALRKIRKALLRRNALYNP